GQGPLTRGTAIWGRSHAGSRPPSGSCTRTSNRSPPGRPCSRRSRTAPRGACPGRRRRPGPSGPPGTGGWRPRPPGPWGSRGWRASRERSRVPWLAGWGSARANGKRRIGTTRPPGLPRHRGARSSVLLFGKRWGESRINGVVDSGPGHGSDSANGLYWRTGGPPRRMTAEERRLKETQDRSAHWRRWGPYLSERQWGTVREDYSPHGTAWEFFPHDHARSRAYRWGEDGLAGISDNHQRLCFAVALWNERDAILKERLYGLTGNEGNHGEDVKEYYFYLDSTPTHSYMKWQYKYPQAAFPYVDLIEKSRQRDRRRREYELLDTGVFEGDRYFDVVVEYAKATADDLLVRITASNRGPDAAPLHVLPTLWFRNTWSWDAGAQRPRLRVTASRAGSAVIEGEHGTLGRHWLSVEGAAELLFTENDSNKQRLWGVPNTSAYVKDAFHDYVTGNRHEAVNPARVGTKAAAHYRHLIGAGETATICLRLTDAAPTRDPFGKTFDATFNQRAHEADEFYARFAPKTISDDARSVMRQAFAGLLWSKQFYHLDIKRWLDGDPPEPPPPATRKVGRDHEWTHLYNEDVISMPDKWEYPWYAAWDLAFHMIPLAMIDPEFAKSQLILF